MPVFIAKYNEHKDELQNDFNDPLLGTIKIPKNLSLLSERLPKAQYETDVKEEPTPTNNNPSRRESAAR